MNPCFPTFWVYLVEGATSQTHNDMPKTPCTPEVLWLPMVTGPAVGGFFLRAGDLWNVRWQGPFKQTLGQAEGWLDEFGSKFGPAFSLADQMFQTRDVWTPGRETDRTGLDTGPWDRSTGFAASGLPVATIRPTCGAPSCAPSAQRRPRPSSPPGQRPRRLEEFVQRWGVQARRVSRLGPRTVRHQSSLKSIIGEVDFTSFWTWISFP